MADPTWERDGHRLYLGDARELLPDIAADAVAVVTDPVWPNCTADIPGKEDPWGLWRAVIELLPPVKRVAVQVSCSTDPAFPAALGERWPFFRVAALDLAVPGFCGRLLNTGDTGYLFGEPPRSEPGKHLIPGRKLATASGGKEADHPCPRKLEHVKWLVHWWGGDVVLDPFMGSGTTGVACVQAGLKFVGIEIFEAYFDVAVTRMEQELAKPMLFGREAAQ